MKLVFSLIVVLSLLVVIQACSYDWECYSVSEHPNFVSCSEGTCHCLLELGFYGLATPESKCYCDSSRDVHWGVNGPLCVSLTDAVQNALEQESAAIKEAKVRQVYQSLIWPTPYIIITSLQAGDTSLMDQLFSPNSHGRVDPVGTYSDFHGVVEYFYGTLWLPFSRASEVVFHEVVVQGNAAAVRVDVLVESYDQTGQTLLEAHNLTETGIFTFDENNLIKGGELIIHRLGKVSDSSTPPGPATINLVCGLILTPAPQGAGCTAAHDPDGYYEDFTDCVNFMNTLDHGTWSDVPMNSLTCRYYHAILAIANPSLHCSHSGKTGGGKCIDHAYDDYYEISYLE